MALLPVGDAVKGGDDEWDADQTKRRVERLVRQILPKAGVRNFEDDVGRRHRDVEGVQDQVADEDRLGTVEIFENFFKNSRSRRFN